MKDDPHERAGRLIPALRVEGISPADRAWLEAHLDGCARCAELAASADRAVRLLRSVSVQIEPELIYRTRLIVHFRARELRARRVWMLPLWISCALSWTLGVISAPFVWQGFEWIGRRMAVPDLLWQMGFVIWWVVPVVAVAVVLAVKWPQVADGS